MKVYETKTETHRVESLIDTICDCCKESIVPDSRYDGSEVVIQAAEGKIFPEGDMTRKYRPDICIECFEFKIIPAFEALGINVKWQE